MLLSLTPQAAAAIMLDLLKLNTSFGNTTGNYTVRLGQNAVNPGSIAGWLDANFGGYTTITTAGGWANGNDSLTLQPTLTLLPPAGGFRWVANTSINATQTVRALRVDGPGNVPLGTGNLESPQSVTSNGDQITIGPVQELVTPLTPAA